MRFCSFLRCRFLDILRVDVDIFVYCVLLIFAETQVDYLRDHYHVYMMKDGRVSMCGMTSSKVEYVANAIYDAVCNVK